MGIHCDKCGHYIAQAEIKYSKSEREHMQFMYELELDKYVKAAIDNPSLIESWEEGKAKIAKDLTVVDCKFPHLFLNEIKECIMFS